MPVRGQARAVDKVRVVHAELFGSLVHARDKRFLAACQVLAERDGRVVAGDDAHGLDEVFDAHLLALFEPDLLPPIDAACALPVTVSSYESAPESMASIVSSSVITFVTLAGSRGVCSSLAKSTVPVCFSIKRAEGASSVSSSARTGTHKSSANSRIIGNIRFMAELLSSFGKEYERISDNMNISP